MAAFTAQSMHQPARFFVSQGAGFAATLANYRPSFFF
jgi:hypothetical protein